MKIKAVFIDIDNTLLDFDDHVQRTLKEGFEYFGVRPYQRSDYELFTSINEPLWKEVEKGNKTIADVRRLRFDIMFKELGFDIDGVTFEKYFEKAIYNHAHPVDGSIELLQFLHRKVLVIAATNGPDDQQNHRLQIGGIAPYFDFVFTSELIGIQKPQKAFFDECTRRMEEKGIHLKKEECLMIGDSFTSDIAGAQNYGMKSLYFEKRPVENKYGIQPDYSFKSLKDAQRFLAEKDLDI